MIGLPHDDQPGGMKANADFAEFKHIIKELEQNKKQLIDSQSIARLGTWRLDVKTNKVFWTEELYKIYGFDPKLPPPDYTEHMKLFTPESWEKLSASLARTASKGIPYELELEMTKLNGEKGWLWVKGEAERDIDGNIVAVWGAAQDITEKTQLFEDLKAQRDKTQKYLDVAGVMLLALNEHGNITLINQKGCAILEDEEKNILGKNWFDGFLPKAIIEKTKYVFRQILNKRIDVYQHHENEIVTAKGNVKSIDWHNTILFDKDTAAITILSSGEDITEKKQSEAALIESNARFETLFENAPLGYQSLDADGRFLEVNRTWLNLMGYEKSEVIGHWFGDFLVPKYREDFKIRFEAFKALGKTHVEFEMLRKDGERLVIEFEGLIGYDDRHRFRQTYCTLNDITERRKIEDQIKKSERDLILAQSIAKVGSWELNIKTKEMWASEEVFKIYGLERGSGYIKLALVQKMVAVSDRGKMDQALIDLINGSAPYDVTFKLHARDGKTKYIHSKASLFSDSDGRPGKILGTIHDITEIKVKELELNYISQHDYLTNLFNRRYFMEQFARLDAPQFYPLGLMMFDVNGLKIINDALGHKTGDVALRSIADFLKKSFDPKDIVARIGGDEFGILLPNTSIDTLHRYKEQIVSLVKTQTIGKIELSIAVGYECKTSVSEAIDELQRSAEDRMYRHKTTIGASVRSRTINAILVTLTDKFANERRHSLRVGDLCKRIGTQLKLEDDEIKELEQVGLFHDIGKISIPDNILNKPGRLTAEEYEIIKTHTEFGYQILRAADEYSDLAVHALHHHERWDGNGYPGGLNGTEIPLFSRITAIADAYEAMTSARAYRGKMDKASAVAEIIKCSGKQFDPAIAKVFVQKVLRSKWSEPA